MGTLDVSGATAVERPPGRRRAVDAGEAVVAAYSTGSYAPCASRMSWSPASRLRTGTIRSVV
jgi:hypothetical protein